MIVSVRVIIMRSLRKIKIHTIPIILDANMNEMFEGDIEKTSNFMKMLRRAKLAKKDTETKKTWPKGIVPYVFYTTFGKNNGNNLNPSNDRAFVWKPLSVSLFSFFSFFLLCLSISYIYI